MLTDELKQQIQNSYSQYLQARGLQPRYGQRLMIAELAKAIAGIDMDSEGVRTSENHVCVLEAGTGTGKTLAYLLATVPLAQALGKQIVISTATVALQDQIVNKDIPELLAHSPLRFSYQLAKGRGRYLCMQQLQRLLSAGGEADPNLSLWQDLGALTVDKKTAASYQKMHQAIVKQQWQGDRDQWPEEISDQEWQPLTTDQHRCSGRNCAHYDDCLFYRARNDVRAVQVIVANHDLVLADLALGGGAVLPSPEQTIYVFDEGHHLPEKALKHFSNASQLRSSQGWLDDLNKLYQTLVDSFPEVLSLAGSHKQMLELTATGKQQLGFLLTSLTPLANAPEASSTDKDRILYRFAQGETPEALREQASSLAEISQALAASLEDVHQWFDEVLEGKHPQIPKKIAEDLYPLVGFHVARSGHLLALWQSFAAPGREDYPVARWLNFYETAQGIDIELACSPILANEVLREYLWRHCFAAVVTSATLMAMNCFDRFKMRAGVPADTLFHAVPSPFDYPRVARLVVPEMRCDPTDNFRHTEFVIDYLLAVGGAGATLVLFTSKRQLEEVYQGLPDDFAERVLAQGEMAKAEIIRLHKARTDQGRASIILGLASFAEGIDLPGKYCEHVVIVRLPFAVPEDPVDATLAEWIKSRGGNPFMQIAVPDAAIRLKQAVGRLIRTEVDQGTISILDRRLLKRHYGKAILKSLPPIPLVDSR